MYNLIIPYFFKAILRRRNAFNANPKGIALQFLGKINAIWAKENAFQTAKKIKIVLEMLRDCFVLYDFLFIR